MAERPPSREEALKLMSKTPNLIRRPLLVYGSQIIIGFDEAAYRKLAKL
jgi:arsenate reductase-like glutaredoxin family protein